VCDVGSTAQRSVFIGGEAARHAARQARMQILRAGGGQPGELMLSWPYLVDREGRRVADLGTLAAEHPEGTIGGSATARVPGPGASYCALAADVSVDTETGQVRVDRVTAAVDCGRVVDPAGARGQVIGGIVQGVGLACLDEWVPDPDGRGPATILEHGAPSAGDAPALTVLFREADPGCQATGLGELPIVPVAAAVANAVAAATGVRFKAAPLRPAAVWRRLQETARAQQ
jgi:CO/xanthine dehydrogenase Mo-binding subunit